MGRNRKISDESNLSGYLYISPWLVGFLLLTIWPILQSFYLSFTDYPLLSEPKWSGLNNYSRIFGGDPLFLKSLGVTFAYVVFSVPLKLFFSLMVAILLNRSIRGISIYRTMVYIPSLIGGSVAVAVLWRNMFGREGYINHILDWFGITGIGWVSNPQTALGTLVLLSTWQFGSTMIIFLAGLKQIPKDLYESAGVDGASKIGQFFHITLPMLSPVMFFNLVLGIIGSFQMFNSAFIVTHGGPANSTYTYALLLYDKAFKNFEMGYASALAWFLLFVIALLSAINFYASKYWVFYESEGGSK
ncbi:carbohydrate ABC transporter permease [Paenibacillus piri]|uniref:Sugar ABC transporter permease n=1 Tax=Paenibacillus piri TaxID=2547395 RepID=A0A4R5KXR3_9BACL|nr:sugar ABC transporter permease [Paenibacillus piri]TDG00617.1 sugar ABC transporter permease [Paenibacillus piri]